MAGLGFAAPGTGPRDTRQVTGSCGPARAGRAGGRCGGRPAAGRSEVAPPGGGGEGAGTRRRRAGGEAAREPSGPGAGGPGPGAGRGAGRGRPPHLGQCRAALPPPCPCCGRPGAGAGRRGARGSRPGPTRPALPPQARLNFGGPRPLGCEPHEAGGGVWGERRERRETVTGPDPTGTATGKCWKEKDLAFLQNLSRGNESL